MKQFHTEFTGTHINDSEYFLAHGPVEEKRVFFGLVTLAVSYCTIQTTVSKFIHQ
jgi:hypothetical protein